MRSVFARTRDWIRRRRIVAAFDEEMQFHLEELAADYRRRGLTPDAALAAAVREFGNTTRTREDLRAQAGWPVLEELGRDAWLAVRGLGRRPAFTVGVTAMLALGLGAAMTLIVLVDAVFLRPLPVAEPAQLHLVRDEQGDPALFSAGTARRFAATLPAGAGVAIHATGNQATVQRGTAPAERAHVQLVEGGFFQVLGIQPIAGRLLMPADDAVGGAAAVAVVGEAWARERFGSPLAALGVDLQVNRHPVSIVGVVPEAFAGLVVGQRTHLWLPAALQPNVRISGNAWAVSSNDRPNDPDWNREERVSWLQLLVRLPAERAVPVHSLLRTAFRPALEDLAAAMDDPREREALERRSWQLVPAPAGYSHVRSSFGSTSRLLAGIVAALLLLTAANVSNLLLVRTLARHRELGVRLALGSGRWRICRLAIVEALVLSTCGALGGWLVASWILPAAAGLLVPGQSLTLEATAWRPLAALVALAIAISGLCAWAPAAWISRLDPLVALAGRTGATRTPVRLGRMLVVVQLALAVVLVAIAVSTAKEVRRTLSVDPGFATAQVLTTTFDPVAAGYRGAEAEALYQRIEALLRTLPGVQAVGLSGNGILVGSKSRSGLYPRGDDVRIRFGQYQSDHVLPGYFDAVGLTLLRGRTLLPSDDTNAPRVAVVTHAFARELFGEVDPVGRQFGYGVTPQADDFTIVGVVSDVRLNAIDEPAPPVFFVPVAQAVERELRFLAVRTPGAPEALARQLREVLARAEPGIVWARWQTLEERIAGSVRGQIAASWLVTSLAAVALSLAGLGVGVSLAHLVALRRREIAVRMALGADRGQIVRSVLVDAWRLGGVGALLGLVLVAALSRVPMVQAGLAEPWDGWAVVGAIAAGFLATTLGAWAPVRRATRVDPQRLLTAE